MAIEVFGVSAGIATPVLRQEHAVRGIRPPRAGVPYVRRPEVLGQITSLASAPDVIDEAAHDVSLTGKTRSRQVPGSDPQDAAKGDLGHPTIPQRRDGSVARGNGWPDGGRRSW